jgi:hypothetical protein
MLNLAMMPKMTEKKTKAKADRRLGRQKNGTNWVWNTTATCSKKQTGLGSTYTTVITLALDLNRHYVNQHLNFSNPELASQES